jgi:transposase
MEDTVSVALAMTIENIRFMENQCKKLDKIIARELEAIPQTLTTIPGIGNVLAAGIIAEIGDINRFENEKALAKFAGLDHCTAASQVPLKPKKPR